MRSPSTEDVWALGPIPPRPPKRTVAISVRMPEDVHEALKEYARKLRAPRSYVVVECLRQLFSAHFGDGRPARRRPRALQGRGRQGGSRL